jgi:methionyl-tRNA formyltransferase
VGPLFEDDQNHFEQTMFFGDTPHGLDRVGVAEVDNINSADAHRAIAGFAPTLGLVFGTRRLSPATIALFAGGLLNVHRGISQNYRGLDSDLWAIYHSDWTGIGATIHFVETQLDTGAILAQERLELTPGMKCHELRFYTTVSATRMMRSILQGYLAGRIAAQAQAKIGRYYSFMPLVLREIVAQRFDHHCATLDDQQHIAS